MLIDRESLEYHEFSIKTKIRSRVIALITLISLIGTELNGNLGKIQRKYFGMEFTHHSLLEVKAEILTY